MTAYHHSTSTCLTQAGSEERIDGRRHNVETSEPIDHQWLQRYYRSLPMPPFGKQLPMEDFRDAYVFGLRSRTQNKAPYSEVYDILKETWNDLIGPSVLPWEDAEPIIQYAY